MSTPAGHTGAVSLALRFIAGAVSWLVLAGTAHAARVLVALPPTEAPAAWESALAIAGLQLAPRTGSPRIVVLDDGARWRIRAHGADGRWREANIAPPRTAAAREDAMFLAQSLLYATDIGSGWSALPGPRPTPLPRPPAVTLPAPRPAPRRSAQETHEPPEPPAEPPPADASAVPRLLPAQPAEPPRPRPPEPLVGPPEPPVRPTPAPATVAPPTPEGRLRPADSGPRKPNRPPSTSFTLSPRASIGSALRVRPGETFGGDVEVEGGVGVGAWGWLGVHAAVAPPTALLALGDDRTLMEVDIAASGTIVLPGRLHPGLAVHAGGGWRSFSDAGAPVAQGWTPILSARARLPLPLGASTSVEPWVEGLAELRPIDLVVDGSRSRLPPFVARAGLSFVLQRMDRAGSLPAQ